MSTDAELLRRYAAHRSEAAFTELVQRHFRPVYAVALRKVGGHAHLAGDVAQSVFTDLARKADRLSRHPALTGWLFSSTHFAAAKLVRSEQRRRARELAAHLMSELTPDTGPDWERLRPLLDDLISGLGERDRHALLLRFFEGCTLAEISTRLGLTEKGARSRVERALDRLSGGLAQRGVRSTAGALATVLATQTAVAVPAGLADSVAGTAVTAAGSGVTFSFLTLMKAKTTLVCALALLTVSVLTVRHWAHASSHFSGTETTSVPVSPDRPPWSNVTPSAPSAAPAMAAANPTEPPAGAAIAPAAGTGQPLSSGLSTLSSRGKLFGAPAPAGAPKKSGGAAAALAADSAAAGDRTVLLVNLQDLFSKSNRTLAYNEAFSAAQSTAMRNVADLNTTAQSKAPGNAYFQSVRPAFSSTLQIYKDEERKRILAAVESYRAANGFLTVYDSTPRSTETFGLPLLPPGSTGTDRTNEVLQALNQDATP